MATTIPNSISNMISSIPKLNDTNWFIWSKKMKMVFLASDLPGIASGTVPTGESDKDRWTKLNSMMIAYVYMAIDEEYQYLIEDEESASGAWQKLKVYFERSTMGLRINARKELYDTHHDPSRPITLYIQSLTSAKQKLEALGCKVEDTEFKDLLLMHLDPSYHSIRTSILAQSSEPSLDNIKSILMSSTAADIINIKTEPIDMALASQGRFSKKSDPVDEKGFRWCDTTNDGACHRCGRPNHIAARCMYNMPQHVKDWISFSKPRPSSPSPLRQAHVLTEETSSYSFTDLDLGPLLI